MLKYILGMDGGGTKTIAYVADGEENLRKKIISGVLNINGQSEQNVEKTVHDIAGQVKEAGYRIEDCEKIGIGMAGYSNAKARKIILQYFRQEGFSCPIYLFGDHETALAAAFPDGNGIILVAGTGSICHGKGMDGTTARSGGCGSIMDDEGSAYALAVKILKAVVKAWDGRGEETILSELLFQKLKISSMEELIHFVYDVNTNKKEIASLAELIEKAAAVHDRTADRIEDECAEELYQLFRAVKRKLPKEKNLVFSGSVLNCNKRIRKKLLSKISQEYPDMQIADGEADAAKGAVGLLRKAD